MKRLITVFIILFSIYSANADILSPENNYDFLVVYHNDFQLQVDEYVKWRKAQGVNLIAVNVQDIYKHFKNNNTSNQQAIRGFVSFTLTYWKKPAPKYLLICGSINHIPSFKISSYFSALEDEPDSISVDYFYSVNENANDGLPDLSIGRLPSRKPEELQIMFNKIYEYEGLDFFDDYEIDFLNVVDSKDSSDFERISEFLINEHYPENTIVERAYFSDDSPFHSDVVDFHKKLNRKVRFVNYIGHGHPKIWSHENILTTEHIDTLTFADDPFVLLTLACSQNFDDTESPGIAEKLLSIKDGGALLTIGSSGVNMLSMISEFGREFYNSLFYKNQLRAGDILRNIIADHNNDLFKRFTLLGDPYLHLHTNKLISNAIADKIYTEEFYSAHPNPFEDRTNIDLEITEPKNITISIFDFTGKQIATIFSGLVGRGTHNYSWDAGNHDTGVYFCKIEKKDETIVIPLIIEK